MLQDKDNTVTVERVVMLVDKAYGSKGKENRIIIISFIYFIVLFLCDFDTLIVSTHACCKNRFCFLKKNGVQFYILRSVLFQ